MTTEMPDLPVPNFAHLRAMTARLCVMEQSRFSTPRLQRGFCTDDSARALVVVSRQASSDSSVADLAAIYLRSILEARTDKGGFHNRRSTKGVWLDVVGSDDSQGRAWWALGAVARHGYEPWMRRAGVTAFDDCSGFDSPHLRSNAFAVLGAVDLLAVEPTHAKAGDLLARASLVLASAVRARIPWPEVRLTYENARIPEAMIAAGANLGENRMIELGVRLLERLLWVETDGDHFSFTPVGGWQTGEARPGFDQRPLEAAAMAEACYRAWTVTGNSEWRVRTLRAAHWLMGRNDTGAVLYDTSTGATCDGLRKQSLNEHQGAEATLAGLAILQIAAACFAKSPSSATR